MPKVYFANKSVAVTGASSGIGYAIALALAGAGADVIAIARDTGKLKQLELAWLGKRKSDAQKFEAISCDLTDERAIRDLAARPQMQRIDMLIHCAGVSYPQYLEGVPAEEVERMFRTNLLAPVQLTRCLLPALQSRKAGHIAFVTSIAGELNIVGYSVYSASKAGLTAFADSLRNELVPHGIRVSVILPPDTDTPMLQQEKRTRPEITNRLSGDAGLLSADTVAGALLDGMATGKFKIYPDWSTRIFSFVFRMFPRLARKWLDWRVGSLAVQLNGK